MWRVSSYVCQFAARVGAVIPSLFSPAASEFSALRLTQHRGRCSGPFASLRGEQ
jgi:hypothetical protein